MPDSTATSATARIGHWLEWRFRDHAGHSVERHRGTYGCVWILELPTSGPRRVAYKGLDPERNFATPAERQLFEREIGIWMRLPHHRCVLPALNLEFAPGDARLEFPSEKEPAIPLVAMRCMNGSLKEWVSSADYSEADRLWALAQACHGLSWVYSQGIEGHGDLKPDNILYRDLHRELAEEHRDLVLRWEVRVSDFGWADIWRDREGPQYAQKSFRPYLAPERTKGEFVREASDVFALGVIAGELLTGKHPAGAETSRVQGWKSTKYRKWAESGLRQLSGIPRGVRIFVDACLDPDPRSRPTTKEMSAHFCRLLRGHGRFEAAQATLEAWDDAACIAANHQRGARWTEEQLARLSPEARDELIDSLAHELTVSPHSSSAEAVAKWLTAAESLCLALLNRNSSGDVDIAGGVGLRILRLVVRNSGMDLRRQLCWDARSNRPIIPDLEPLEVLQDFVCMAGRTLTRANQIADPEPQRLLNEFSAHVIDAHPFDDFISRLWGSPDEER